MKGTQTITLSQEAVAEAMADYLNKQIKHDGVITVGMINFERDGTLSVDFEDEVIPTAAPAAKEKTEQSRENQPTETLTKERTPTPTASMTSQDKMPSNASPTREALTRR